MANQRLDMRKLREILRLRWEMRLSYEKIAASCGISAVTVGNYLARACAAHLSWPLPETLDDKALEDLLFPTEPRPFSSIPLPDWGYIHNELRKKGVTKQLLWQEYKQANPKGYQYSHFCDLHLEWQKKRRIIFRHSHRAGEKMFVDFAGKTVAIHNPRTGEIKQAQIFVAVLGASQYTYAEATFAQDLPSWITCHVNAFNFFGGVAEIVVPDNLKSGISKPCRYDPETNPTYQEMASYYRCAIIPARVRKPQDKALVEIGVCLVTRWILAVLRKRKFFSLEELNQAIAELLEKLNNKPFQKLEGSRRISFEKLDLPALKSLPQKPYEYAEVKKARVNVDYHITIDRHHYSVPYQLTGEEVMVRMTSTTIEILHKNRRITSHVRSYAPWSFTTNPSHRPQSHQKYLKWNDERFINWGDGIGPATGEFIRGLIACYDHVEQSYSRCLGVFRFGGQYGNDRLEAACKMANNFKVYSYKALKRLLEQGLSTPLPEQEKELLHHTNIRGGDYYR